MPCRKPFYVKEYKANIPCGICAECFKRKVSQWQFRLMQEDKHADSSQFITLTYNVASCPITEDGRKTILKKHVSQFIKKLRACQRRRETKHFRKLKVPMSRRSYSRIKFYGVGEYGGKTRRPHYHVILFNADASLIDQSWDNGTVHHGEVSGASVGYTLKYISKRSRIGRNSNDTRNPTFSLQSKGLGLSYLTPAMIQWHKADLQNRMYCTISGGRKVAMPRYYKLRIYSELEKQALADKFLLEKLEELYQQAIEDYQDNDPVKHQRARHQDHLAANRRMKLQSSLNEKL
ncbi:replication initiator protein [robinz microvirus RP_65]|nr:replication initiator protein [robinz microvirus RP_65]